jgi:hypothetical protein
MVERNLLPLLCGEHRVGQAPSLSLIARGAINPVLVGVRGCGCMKRLRLHHPLTQPSPPRGEG